MTNEEGNVEMDTCDVANKSGKVANEGGKVAN